MSTNPTAVLRPALHVVGLGRRALAWPVTSQHVSRRNAMLAASEVRRRRAEQQEVEDFLAAHRSRHAAATG